MGKSLCVAAPINTTRFLDQWLEHIEKYADFAVCIAHKNEEVADRLGDSDVVEFVCYREDDFHETIFRNQLYQEAYNRGADFVLLLDVDEKMDDRFVRDIADIMENDQAAAFSYAWYNFWGGEEKIRVDGRWMPEWRRRIKLMRAYDIKPWLSGWIQYSPNGFVIPDERKIIKDNVYRTLHYGFIDQSIRDHKREVWKKAPPSLKEGWDNSDKGDIKLMDFLPNETHEEFMERRKKS